MAATPTQQELDRKARAFVVQATGLSQNKVIPGNDPHPEPRGSYATVLEITKLGSGIDSEVARETGATTFRLDHKGRRSITYSVQFYRDGAADFIEGLLSYAATTPGQVWLAEQNLTWALAGPVTNLDTVINSKFEIRRAVDITFRYQSVRQVDINAIGSVEIDMTLSDSNDLTETVEVTDA